MRPLLSLVFVMLCAPAAFVGSDGSTQEIPLHELTERWAADRPGDRDAATLAIIKRWEVLTAEDLALLQKLSESRDSEMAHRARSALDAVRAFRGAGRKVVDLLGSGASLLTGDQGERHLLLEFLAEQVQEGSLGDADLEGVVRQALGWDLRESLLLHTAQKWKARAYAPLVAPLLRHKDSSIRRSAVETLSSLGARQYAPDIALLLKRGETDMDDLVRSSAAWALHLLEGTEHAKPYIAEIVSMLQDPKPRVRWKACHMLGSLRPPEHAASLAPLLQDPDPMVRNEAIKTLGYMRAASCADKVSALLQDPSHETRLAALGALVNMKGRSTAPILVTLLRDKHPEVQMEALRKLGELHATDHAREILALLQQPGVDGQVRWCAAFALGELQPKDCVKDIAKLMKDPRSGVQYQMVELLGDLEARDHVEDIASMLDGPEPETKSRAVKILARWQATEYSGKVASLLRDEDGGVLWSALDYFYELGPGLPQASRELVIQQAANFKKEPLVARLFLQIALIGLGDESARKEFPWILDRLDEGAWFSPVHKILLSFEPSEARVKFGREHVLSEPVTDLKGFMTLCRKEGLSVRATEGIPCYRKFRKGEKVSLGDLLESFLWKNTGIFQGELKGLFLLEGSVIRIVPPEEGKRLWENRLSDK